MLFTSRMENSVNPDQKALSVVIADLDLQYFQKRINPGSAGQWLIVNFPHMKPGMETSCLEHNKKDKSFQFTKYTVQCNIVHYHLNFFGKVQLFSW